MTQATAKVKLELELSLDDTWGDDCTVGQIHKQACDSASHTARRILGPSDFKLKSLVVKEICIKA